MSLHLIIGDKLLSSWSLRGALALDLTGETYTEELIKLGQPDTRERLLKHSPTGKVPLLKTEHGTIADSLAIAEYLATEQFPRGASLAKGHSPPRAVARIAPVRRCTPGSLRLAYGNMPMDLRRDAAPRQRQYLPIPRPTSSACWRCGTTAVRSCCVPTPAPFLFGHATVLPMLSSRRLPYACAPIRCRCRRRPRPARRNHLPMANLPGLASSRPGGLRR